MRDEGRNIGIIGGTGRMGGLFQHIFEDAGCIVEVIGRAPASEYREFVKRCGVILISVPIQATSSVIQSIGSVLEEDQLIADLTSIKVMPVAAMLESAAQVIGLHPLFGPDMASISGQKLIMTPARARTETVQWLMSIFRHTGMQVFESTAEEHDAAMAIMQGLIHFQNILLAKTLRKLNCTITNLLPYATPNAHTTFAFMARTLSQDSELYGGMLLLNPGIKPIISSYAKSFDELTETILSVDMEGFRREFTAGADFTAPFNESAKPLTDHLLDQVVREW
ncbi:prephenate dehydrogenase/arogenate dehydrogenase family protein [Methanocalculus sp.]|uniref:prephenate dehydrogenase/arogenate dehydrogenase family protein n=1 Tax=Methanocalculus sp. TaxID=2004547 RepID=UPI00271B11FD|nr:prephenate dehydrogenase/arogenate dehydrogenase family protein [Methanocalculus sp.]MDO8841493.1 prephenate dehydrogenase/arogenate dehydrogenase family protein [Methanocalculus sp.]